MLKKAYMLYLWIDEEMRSGRTRTRGEQWMSWLLDIDLDNNKNKRIKRRRNWS